MFNSFKETSPLKHSEPISVTDSGNATVSNFAQSENAFAPIVFTPSGITTSVNLPAPDAAFSGIFSIPASKEIFLTLLSSNGEFE